MHDAQIALLMRTQALLEYGWCRGTALARDAEGKPASVLGTEASAWSLNSALAKAAHELHVTAEDFAITQHLLKQALYTRYGLLLAWAELDPHYNVRIALSTVEQVLQDLQPHAS